MSKLEKPLFPVRSPLLMVQPPEKTLYPSLAPTLSPPDMNVDVLPDGRLKILEPKCRAGDSLVLRAEMDLVIALSACPASTCNGGAPPRALAFEVS